MPGEELVIVHEQLTEFGGVERVLEGIAAEFPAAPIYGIAFEGRVHPRLERLPNPIHAVETTEKRNHFEWHRWATEVAKSFDVVPAVVALRLVQCGWGIAADTTLSARTISYSSGLARPYFNDSENYFAAMTSDEVGDARQALPGIKRMYKQLLQSAPEVWTVSRWSQRNLLLQAGVQSRVVHPYHHFRPAALDGPCLFGRERESPRVVAVGRFVRHKRFELVVESARQTGFETVVVGVGPEDQALRRNAPPNVRFVGQLSDSDLLRTLSDADLLVCPSAEEYGLVMMEAMSCGTPVVAPRAGAAVELILHGVTGYLIDHPLDESTLSAGLAAAASLEFSADACRKTSEMHGRESVVSALKAALQA